MTPMTDSHIPRPRIPHDDPPAMTGAERDALIDQWREARRTDRLIVLPPDPTPHRTPVAVEILAAIGLLTVVLGPAALLVVAVLWS